MNTTSSRPKLVVTADGTGVVSHAGARLLTDLAEATGLERALSAALAPMRQRDVGHYPSRVAADVDVAVIPADGGEAISDLAVLTFHRPRPLDGTSRASCSTSTPAS